MSSLLPEPRRLAEIVRVFPTVRLVVCGDLIADVFVYGEIARISREAPVMILREEKSSVVPGGAGNAAANAASLGARVTLLGIVGQDESGGALLEHLKSLGIDCDGISTVAGHRTPTKTRILAGLPGSSRQQVIRVDREPVRPIGESEREPTLSRLGILAEAGPVILSDYQYGFLDGNLLEALLSRAIDSSAPWVVDSRRRLTAFKGLNSATPNLSEVEELLNRSLPSTSAVGAEGDDLRKALGMESLLITMGRDGMMLFPSLGGPAHLEVIGGREPVDVTGAGDTVIATYALALGAGADPIEAAVLANHAAGVVVMKRGTASVTSEELLSSILHHIA